MITSSLELLTAPYAFEASHVYVPRWSLVSLVTESIEVIGLLEVCTRTHQIACAKICIIMI